MDMSELLLTTIAFLFGFAVACLLLQSRVTTTEERWRTRFEQWKLEYTDFIRSEYVNRSSSTLKGKIAEQMAPLLPEFSYNPADARFIGSPVDFVVFEGYTGIKDDFKGDVNIVFIEVKKGRSTLSKKQQAIRQAVEEKKVRWETIVVGDREAVCPE
jgi:predicted Holliday junction resolvase-like endonuclease